MFLPRLRQSHRLRTALQVLLLCFALGTMAQAGHRHDLHSSTDTHFHCDYCTAFGGLIDAPAVPTVVDREPIHATMVAAPECVLVARSLGLPQARAPPTC